MSHKSRPRILVLVIHGLYSPWKEILLRGQLPTWAGSRENIDVIHGHGRPVIPLLHAIDQFLYSIRLHPLRWLATAFVLMERVLKSPFRLGNWSPSIIEGTSQDLNFPVWEVQMPDLAILQAHKTLSLLIHATNYDYDYVITTNSSSYINLEFLYERISHFPRNNLLSGRFVSLPEGGSFPSGAFRVFSIDVLEKVKSKRELCNHWIPEDVALGRLLQDSSYHCIDMSSLDLPSIETIDKYSKNQLSSIAHFRCKSGSLRDRNDVKIMLELHERLTT